MERISFTFAELGELKRRVTGNKPYADRLSASFAIRLMQLTGTVFYTSEVLDEIDFLEDLRTTTRTKPAEPFHRPPLTRFWHKHVSTARHIGMNIGIRWALDKSGNDDLDRLLSSVADEFGDEPDVWPKVLAHRLINQGYEERASRGYTGDWIIYGVHQEKNYYMDLASHSEGRDGEALYRKLERGCKAEFPFLFDPDPSDTQPAA